MKGYFTYAGFLVITLLFSAGVFSQKQLNDASFTYNISVVSEGNNQAAKAFEGASLTVYLKGTQSRTEMVNALGTESSIFDTKSGKGAILKEYSGQKLMITLTRENWAQKNQYFQQLSFTLTGEEKTINGFACKKATALGADGNQLVVYYSTEMQVGNKQYNNAFANLPGLPVQYELQSGNLTVTYTLKNVNNDPVPSARFELPKSGYRTITYEETQQLRKNKR